MEEDLSAPDVQRRKHDGRGAAVFAVARVRVVPVRRAQQAAKARAGGDGLRDLLKVR